MMGGCVQSLHPLFTEKDIIFEEKLVGIWSEDPNSKEIWEFKKADANSYEFIYTDSDCEDDTHVASAPVDDLGKWRGLLRDVKVGGHREACLRADPGEHAQPHLGTGPATRGADAAIPGRGQRASHRTAGAQWAIIFV